MLMVEGFATFGRSWRGWLKLALIFFALWLAIAILGVWLLSDVIHAIISMNPDAKHKMTPDEAHALLAILNIPAFVCFSFLVIALSVAQYYMMVMFFSDKEKLFGQSVMPKVGGFFYACWKAFLAGLIGVVPIIAAMILIAIAAMVKTPWLAVLFGLISVGFLIFLTIKYTLVFPLAANGLKSPIKASWHITDGNWWPLFGNNIVLFLVMYCGGSVVNTVVGLCVGIPVGVSVGLTKVDPKEMSQIFIYVMVVMGCINSVIWAGINAAYKVACVRVLDHEKSNPVAPT